jgi:hypothetical protein
VNPAARLTLVLAAAAAAAGIAAWLVARARGRRAKSPAEIERQRRLEVHRHGRIAMGQVVDIVDSDSSPGQGRLILYHYEVAGVTYEAAQDISALASLVAAAHGLAGQIASVKYDPKHPANSIIACEEWCGIKELQDGEIE